MTVIGFNFTKIGVEHSKPIKGKVKITNNIAIRDVTTHDLTIGKSKQHSLKFTFEFLTKYEKDFGHISLTGDILYLGEEKKLKDIQAKWKKNKSVPKDVMTKILNNILNKCNVEALILSQHINLPAPIPLPKINVEEKKK